MADYVQSFASYFKLGAEDKVICQSSISFDTHVEEIYPILLCGGSLIMSSEGGRDIEKLAELIETQQATVLSTTPLIIDALNKQHVDQLKSLRTLISGGDVFKASHMLQLPESIEVYNTYGPTESTVCATYHHIDKRDEVEHIGKPVTNRSIFLLGDDGQLCPHGSTGEICIGGKGLYQGYLDSSKDRWVNHPLRSEEKLYPTGDLGRWTEGGVLQFEGRKDSQISFRGYRIEPEEVEHQLALHPAIENACVLIEEGDQPRLIAYLQLTGALSRDEARSWARKQLPAYMVPSEWYPVDKIPMTNHGKTDYRKLKTWKIAPLPETTQQQVEIDDPEFELIMNCWKSLLKTSKAQPQDDFFESGGHSILATQLLSQIEAETGKKIPFRDFLHNPNPAMLYEAIKTDRDTVASIPRVDEAEFYPLAPAQRRLWLEFELGLPQQPYHLSWRYKVSGALEAQNLKKSFQKLIKDHDIFRTAFWKVGNEARQFVREWSSDLCDWKAESLKGLADPEGYINERIQALHEQSFDLGHPPLIKVRLFQFNEEEYQLFILMHHIIADAWSLNLIVKELLAHQQGEKLAKPSGQPRYIDFSQWHQQYLEADHGVQSREYWAKQLDGDLPSFEFPTDQPRSKNRSYKGRSIYQPLPVDFLQWLKQRSKEWNMPQLSLLTAVTSLLFYRHSRQQEMVLGTAMSGRIHPNTLDMMGFFVNILPLRIQLDPEASFKALCDSTNQLLLEAYDHQAYPFDQIVEDLDIRVDQSRMALFDVMVQMLHLDEDLTDAKGKVRFEKVENPTEFNQFDLLFDFIESAGETGLRLTYNTDLYNDQRMEALARHFNNLCLSLSTADTEPIHSLPMLDKAEKKELSTKAEGQFIPLHDDQTNIAALFEQIVKQYPDRIACTDQGKNISYAELNDKVNELASYIIWRYDPQPDELIGVYCDRNINQIITILAILKSGAAYLPVDIEYPEDRVTFTFRDARASTVVTDQPESRLFDVFQDLDVVNLNTDPIDLVKAGNPPQRSEAKDLAYVIYTSGSTGKPKGVLVTQQNVISLLFHQKFQFDFDQNDVWTLFHSVCFDFSVWELYGSLLFGGRLVTVPTEIAASAPAYTQLLAKEQVTVMNQVPTVFYNLSNSLVEKGPEAFALRYVIFGGEALNFKALTAFKGSFPK